MYQLAAIFWGWQPGLCWCDISHEKSSVEDYISRMMDNTVPLNEFRHFKCQNPGEDLWWFNGPNIDRKITTSTTHFFILHWFFIKVVRWATCLLYSFISSKPSQLTVSRAHPVRSGSCGFHMPPKVLLCTRLALVNTKFVFKSASAALCV